MRIFFFALLILHGLLHFTGFAKAYNLAEIPQLAVSISRFSGIFWLVTTILFLLAAISYLLKYEWWWIPSIAALAFSQYLIISSWQDAKYGTLANAIILIITVIGFSTWSFSGKYEKDVSMQLHNAGTAQEELLTEADLHSLPQPVQNYMRYAGVVGKPKVKNFKVTITGQIRKNEQTEWMPFISEQYNFLNPPARLFFMKATMKHLPVAGYHRFASGNAYMDIRLLSLFPVQYQEGKEMDRAETVTFFNDMCLMAPATLIDPRITWLKTEGNKVKASFSANAITVTATLYFNKKDQLINFISDDRYAQMEDGTMQQLPWSTPVEYYREINGYKLMGSGDAVYQYPEGEMTYGNFRMENIAYNIE